MAGKFEEIVNEIKQMSPDQLEEFRAWYEGFEISARGEKIEEDPLSRKLEDLADIALLDHKAGRTKRL